MLIGVDDMDLFKGIELKLQAFEQVLDYHAEWRGRLVLIQVTNPPRCHPCPPPPSPLLTCVSGYWGRRGGGSHMLSGVVRRCRSAPYALL